MAICGSKGCRDVRGFEDLDRCLIPGRDGIGMRDAASVLIHKFDE